MAKMFRVYGSVVVQHATKVELFVNLKTAKRWISPCRSSYSSEII
jgi:hypothetical protein